MNIPLDNLYHWIQGLTQHPVILYVFHPHGSKDISDLIQFRNNSHSMPINPVIICHDQEPLDFSKHQFDYDLDRLVKLLKKREWPDDEIQQMMILYSNPVSFPNFRPNWLSSAISMNDWFILLHSEKNSPDVDQFANNGFVPVYYWSHAVIARDWYRFAEHDSRLGQRQIEKTFLVYCRDWTPTREYRLKFLDLLIDSDLYNDCVLSTQHVSDQGIHLKDYQAQDPRFAVDTNRLLCIPDNNIPPTASADYDVKDIITTAVSVILETVVDGSKIHLTEKTLRPIACGHPFVLLAGPGALAYLKSYGFKTFSEFWDESYDKEPNTVKRMEKIVQTMQQIQQLDKHDWAEINKITEYNKQQFFSQGFIQQVYGELQENLNHAVGFCLEHYGDTYWRWRKVVRRLGLTNQFRSELKCNASKESIQKLRKDRLRRSQNKSSP